jgi:hypothetical protein
MGHNPNMINIVNHFEGNDGDERPKKPSDFTLNSKTVYEILSGFISRTEDNGQPSPKGSVKK